MIVTRRVYGEKSHDGYRVLVDRLWPRGLKKEDVRPDLWLKDIAPSTELRKWFNHEPERLAEFSRRYARELDGRQDAVRTIVEKAKRGKVILLYGAKDPKVNHAVVLKEYLEKKAGEKAGDVPKKLKKRGLR